MTILVYCTVDDIAENVPGDVLPDDRKVIERMIKFASAIIRRHTVSAVYRVTKDGAPFEQSIKEAFQSATIAQVRAYLEAKLTMAVFSGGIGLEPTVAASSANGASVTFSDSGSDAAVKNLLHGGLCKEAWLYLADAGLLDNHPAIRE